MLTIKNKESIINNVAATNNFTAKQVATVLDMLNDGNTVPFIARYRQEHTNGLNEEQIRVIQKEFDYITKLEKRKEEIIALLTEREMITPELEKQIVAQVKMSELENIYYPYREKKKTKATEAIAKGLEPLAIYIMEFNEGVATKAAEFVDVEKDVNSIEEAITGALHIIAERTMENSEIRSLTKNFILGKGSINSTKKKNAVDEIKLYEIYYDFSSLIKNIKPYQTLAINRAEKEKIVAVKFIFDQDYLFNQYYKFYIKNDNECEQYVKEAIADGYKRLLLPSIERELRSELTEAAEQYSIKEIFTSNLEKTLLQKPLKGKKILGIDPGFVSGCKLTIIDETGKMIWKEKMYPHPPQNKKEDALRKLEESYRFSPYDVIAIGNGTASRETEELVVDFIKDKDVEYIIVSESGASVYSASKLAKEEFPDLSVEERSAVSIARRLQDPLAELVKIDVKSIGVGQYQHDMNQKLLVDELSFVIEKIVNEIGVDINTASAELLNYISGLTKTTAKNIIEYRNANGEIVSRKEIAKVKGIGPKAFEQSVGFLRIINGNNVLDKTEIHPEKYDITMQLLKDKAININDFGTEKFNAEIAQLNKEELASEYNISIYDMELILSSLAKKTIDPRDQLDAPIFKRGIIKMNDLKQGEVVQGVVRNITEFGAFVDIGLKNDALLHKANMASTFVNDPRDIVEVGETIEVVIHEIDEEKGRVGLRIPGAENKVRQNRDQGPKLSINDFQIGQQLTARVVKIERYGAFVDLGMNRNVLLHNSKMADYFVKDPNDIVDVNDEIKVEVLELDTINNKIEIKLVEAARSAKNKYLTIDDLEIGATYEATVNKIVDFGAFVNFGMYRDVLLHKSKIDDAYIEDVTDFINVGDVINVTIDDIDYIDNKIQISKVA